MSHSAPAELVVIDPQNIFASEDSKWGSPFFGAAFQQILNLAPLFTDRLTVTRWLPTAERKNTSWEEYFQKFRFADVPASHALYDLVPEAVWLSSKPLVEEPTFGKWGSQLRQRLTSTPHLVLTGVSTDCCVISTALAAADAGCWVTIVENACAGSTQQNHDAAVHVMSLYSPQIRIVSSRELIAELGACSTTASS